jgi:hypothetical protein
LKKGKSLNFSNERDNEYTSDFVMNKAMPIRMPNGRNAFAKLEKADQVFFELADEGTWGRGNWNQNFAPSNLSSKPFDASRCLKTF